MCIQKGKKGVQSCSQKEKESTKHTEKGRRTEFLNVIKRVEPRHNPSPALSWGAMAGANNKPLRLYPKSEKKSLKKEKKSIKYTEKGKGENF
jgi:hypothetical protein